MTEFNVSFNLVVMDRQKTQAEIAGAVNISVVWLNKIVNGKVKRFTDIGLARKIEEASGGRYKAEDLVPGLKEYVRDHK